MQTAISTNVNDTMSKDVYDIITRITGGGVVAVREGSGGEGMGVRCRGGRGGSKRRATCLLTTPMADRILSLKQNRYLVVQQETS